MILNTAETFRFKKAGSDLLGWDFFKMLGHNLGLFNDIKVFSSMHLCSVVVEMLGY
jgi:hypothetical protein